MLLLLLATIPASAQTGLLVPTSTGRPDPRVLGEGLEEARVGTQLATQRAELPARRSSIDRHQPDHRLAAPGNHDLFARTGALNETRKLRFRFVNRHWLHD